MADAEETPRYRLYSPEQLQPRYANFGDVTVSEYEVTLTFAHVDRTPVQNGEETSGMVVSQIVVSPQFARELADTLDDAVERYEQLFGGPGAQPGA